MRYFGDMAKTPKRPRDMMQLAKLVGEIATGETTDPIETGPLPDAKAVRRGKARAAKLTAKERSAIAKKAAHARWKPKKG